MSSPSEKKSYQRLPKNVIPKVYQLELKPDLKKFNFTGNETITVDIKKLTNTIILNAKDIVIHQASYEDIELGRIEADVEIDCDQEKASFRFIQNLSLGEGKLNIQFDGILNDELSGFYRSKYLSRSGEVRYSATTQFEAASARMAFPCWDEPAFKAIFEITLIVPKESVALSNLDPVHEEVYSADPTLRVVRYDRTPIMSSYLVAFVIGEYEFIETQTHRGTRVRVYTPVGKTDQGRFALDIASKCLTFFEDYFDIPYPLPKLDHIAIADFASGAMENWGLITYRETRILADHHNSSAVSREGIAKTICHETAHQWFGNLVTMNWWTDLWLKEGFARFLEHVAVDEICPEFNVWSQFVNVALMRAFRLDSLRNSHPIEVPVCHPDELESIFDEISYDKGACLIRMCFHWIGAQSFQNGLREYLKVHAYGNAVTQDLWNALEKASGLPVSKTMPFWTLQKGYPLLYAQSKVDGNDRILKLNQKKFTLDGQLLFEEDSMRWMVPISTRTSEKNQEISSLGLLTTRASDLVLPNCSPSSWIKLNPNVYGFYRVVYSQEMLDALKPVIANGTLDSSDRMNILSDLFAMVRSCQASTVQWFDLLEHYAQEESGDVWTTIDYCIDKLCELLEYTDFYPLFTKFCISLYSKALDKLGCVCKESDPHDVNLLRALIVQRLVNLECPRVLKELTRMYRDYIGGKPCPPDIRRPVYSAFAVSCDEQSFGNLFELYSSNDLQEEKIRIGSSIGATNDVKRMQKFLNFTLSPAVRIQDAWLLIVSSARSKMGREEAWKFFKTNFVEIKSRYGKYRSASILIENLVSGLATEEQLNDVINFFRENPYPVHQTIIDRSIESVKANISWLTKESQSVKQYLTEYNRF